MKKIVDEAICFFEDKINRIMLIVILLCCLHYYNTMMIAKQHAETINEIKKIAKKVDFRYFNTTNTLQDLFDVEIETHHGHVINR